jgi:anaerobic carbon-monoxide dehydrogenase iron sulfur subunit
MAVTTRQAAVPPESRMHLCATDERCTGCRVCQVFCSFYHERAVQPSRARLWIRAASEPGRFKVTICRQCDSPECVAACPAEALGRDNGSGLVRLDTSLCVGCEACVSACPYGAMGFDAQKNVAFKCDRCDGAPECAALCPTAAVQYLPLEATPASQQSDPVRGED